MRLLRQSTCVVWLALFALVGQLVLSLGHFHPLSPLPSSLATTQLDASRDRAANPGDVPAESTDEHDCAICQTIAVARALVLPEDVRIAFPPCQIVNWPALETGRKLKRHAAPFQARAPPFSSLI